MRALVLVALVGCSTPVAPQPDAAIGDAAHLDDVGTDAGASIDAALEHDVGADASHVRDAFTVDGDPAPACDVFTNAGCATGQACRLTTGVPACESAGRMLEGTNTSQCIDSATGADLCVAHLFCDGSLYTCARYCDAAHNTCVAVHGSPTHCDTAATPPRCVP